MYSKIIVPVYLAEGADTENAFALARVMADLDAEICAVDVIESVPTFSEAYVPADLSQKLEKPAKDRMAALVPDDVTDRAARHGTAGTTILEYAKKKGADYFLESTAARVVRYAQCSVHVLR